MNRQSRHAGSGYSHPGDPGPNPDPGPDPDRERVLFLWCTGVSMMRIARVLRCPVSSLEACIRSPEDGRD